MNNKYEELKNRIDEEIKSIEESKSKLNELIEEVKKAEQEENSSNKMPFEKGEDYYHISTAGRIMIDVWNEDKVDFRRLSQENAFKIRQEAEDKLFQLRLEGKIREFRRINNCNVNEEDLRNINNRKYYICYNLVNGIIIDIVCTNIEPTKLGYFKSREMAERFVESNKKDLIKYFKIEMREWRIND